jgi:mediator of RNA polymerase II transcription subunit 31
MQSQDDEKNNNANSTTTIIDKEEEEIRFQTELEFVQLLANPSYLNYLAQYKYFEEDGFIEYIKYLQYWKQPQYSKFLAYPHCLFFLDRLQDEQFRDECRKTTQMNHMFTQQHAHWRFYRQNREQEATNTTSSIVVKNEE